DDRRRHTEIQTDLRKFDARKPAPLPVAMGLQDKLGEPAKTFVLERGELGQHGDEVEPGYPSIMSPNQEPRPARITHVRPGSTGRRTSLAHWIASKENPLTARVLVNRLWQHHFGRGLLGTPSDFGVRGERPTHPELLDWLASEFVDSGWSIKHIHRLMLGSATYQQSTCVKQASDPENRLLCGVNRLRLEAEAIRDSLLAVSGRLDGRMVGPGMAGGTRRSV